MWNILYFLGIVPNTNTWAFKSSIKLVKKKIIKWFIFCNNYLPNYLHMQLNSIDVRKIVWQKNCQEEDTTNNFPLPIILILWIIFEVIIGNNQGILCNNEHLRIQWRSCRICVYTMLISKINNSITKIVKIKYCWI